MTQIVTLLIPTFPFFEKIGKFVLKRNPYTLFLILVLIFSLKIGVRGILPWADFSPAENFPQPTRTLSSSSLGLLAISKLFSVDTKFSYFLLNILLLFTFLSIFYIFVRRRFSGSLSVLVFLFFLSSPISVVLFGNIGRHDLLTIFGMLFFFLSKNRLHVFFAVLLSNLGSPEHSIAAYSLLFVASIFNIVPGRRKAFLALASSVLYFIGVQIWLNLADEGPSRFFEILPMIDLALRNSLNNGHLELFSYLGYFWFSLILAILMINKSRKVLISLVTFPILFNLIMVDKTRDYVIALIPLVIAVHLEVFGKIFRDLQEKSARTQNIVVGFVLLVTLVLPNLEVTFEGSVRSPYEWFWSKTL